MIEGLKIDVRADELKGLFSGLSAALRADGEAIVERMNILKKTKGELDELSDGLSNAGAVKGRIAELQDEKEELERQAQACDFIAGHLIPGEVYRLDSECINDLVKQRRRAGRWR